jgi:[ribosomal protein S18]-alanine N-acetyltransferase
MRTISVALTPSSSRCPTSNIVLVRPATTADILQMHRLEQQAPSAAHWSSVQYESLFVADSPARIVLVAADNPTSLEVLGFLVARCLPDECDIENLVVAPGSRRKGIGSSLVRALLTRACGRGARALILEVRESNTAARRVYENIGFKPEGRRRAYYQHPTEDALLYRFPLQICDKIPLKQK